MQASQRSKQLYSRRETLLIAKSNLVNIIVNAFIDAVRHHYDTVAIYYSYCCFI